MLIDSLKEMTTVAAAAATPRPHFTVACILLLGLALLAARRYAAGSADDFRVTFLFGRSIILQKVNSILIFKRWSQGSDVWIQIAVHECVVNVFMP